MRTSVLCSMLLTVAAWAAEPLVSNVRASQREGTKLVDILYDLADADSATVSVAVRISSDAGATWTVPATTFGPGSAVGAGVAPGTNKSIVWDAGADWAGQWSDRMRVEVTATDQAPGGDYLVIDVSAGPSATSYPVSYLTAVPQGGWTDEYKTTRIVLRRVPAGTFTMGSPTDELGRGSDETQHEVTLSKDFYIGVFEITQQQYERVTGAWPSYFDNATYRDARPVEQVSWNDIRGGTWPGDPAGTGQPAAGTFIQKLRDRTGLPLDLPTEAQWEYACRAGTTTALNSGKNLTNEYECPNMAEVGRYWDNGGSGYSQGGDTSGGSARAGSYLPNAWGLYDMHGNVWEWCLDWRGTYPGTVTDPLGPGSGTHRALRGGSWHYLDSKQYAQDCRSARRAGTSPDNRVHFLGFRLVRAVP